MRKVKRSSVLVTTLLIMACSTSDNIQPDPEVPKGKEIKQLVVNGTTREYIVYVPENYSPTTPLPVLLSFHGLSSNMEFNYGYTKFNEIAEEENFIVVHPNGIDNKWVVYGSNNPDIDFTEALLTDLQKEYNIDTNRIYSTGMSDGGFFSFSLACGLSERIAAVASVTGSMYQPSINNCSPSRPISILQIHGTEDPIVVYSSVAALLDFWNSHNNTDNIPIVSNITDVDPDDGSTVERFEYVNGDSGVEVHHLKITGGGHQWPGYKGNMDINASLEVWNFVKAFGLDGKIE
ncbi:alpha/beta hydrolase family esterase [Aureicoccus marinus]|jgi:polyhydroxybutyrate depolymerase|nr:alpha/beta hydrolase-fold protein [Aureicoccus marinus]